MSTENSKSWVDKKKTKINNFAIQTDQYKSIRQQSNEYWLYQNQTMTDT